MAQRHLPGAGTLRLVLRRGHERVLDLPWHLPLAAWGPEHVVEVTRGISRHVVRFVRLDAHVYALKETEGPAAEREYALLRRLTAEGLPVVEAVGVVSGRRGDDDEPLGDVLVTRHLEYSLPYRELFARRDLPDPQHRLLDALAVLLVRLHVSGFFWGDCSLSNALFRRDAGVLSAYLVDAETGELHEALSDGQREQDLAVAEENVAGELLDLGAAGRLPPDVEPLATAADLLQRYEVLWEEVTREEVFDPHDRYRIEARLRRLNELGFDVEEFDLVRLDEGHRLRLQPRVVEIGHHTRRLRELVGLDAEEHQACRLLNDIAAHRAELERRATRDVPEAVAAARWLTEVFEPVVEQVPVELWGKRTPAQLYHELLDHRWFLSEAAGRDVGPEAVRSYVENVLTFVPDERTVLPADEEQQP